jgi:hypothetical protein
LELFAPCALVGQRSLGFLEGLLGLVQRVAQARHLPAVAQGVIIQVGGGAACVLESLLQAADRQERRKEERKE